MKTALAGSKEKVIAVEERLTKLSHSNNISTIYNERSLDAK